MSNYTPATIRTIYHRFKNAMIDHDRSLATPYYGMLVDCYDNSKKLMVESLTSYQKEQLRIYFKAYKDGEFLTVVDPQPTSSMSKIDIDAKEKHVVRYMADNEFLLQKALGEPTLRVIDMEVKIPLGRVDLLAKAQDKIYPIEFKINRADHKILGQIIMYKNYYEKASQCGIWEQAIGVAIAPSYTDFATVELRKHGIKTLLLVEEDLKYSLKTF